MQNKEYKKMKLKAITAVVLGGLSLTACASPKMLYQADNYIPANAVKEKKASDKITIPSMPLNKGLEGLIVNDVYDTPAIKKVFKERC